MTDLRVGLSEIEGVGLLGGGDDVLVGGALEDHMCVCKLTPVWEWIWNSWWRTEGTSSPTLRRLVRPLRVEMHPLGQTYC